MAHIHGKNNGGQVLGSTATELSGLTDVNITNPANLEALVYLTGSSRWVNATVSAGGGVKDHGLLDGLLDPNDHPQYRLTADTINFSEIGSTGHSHTESDITDLGDYAGRSFFESHTGDTSNPHQTSLANLVSSAHTHPHNTELTGIQGGSSGEYYHLNEVEYISTTGSSYGNTDPTGFINTNEDSTISFNDGTRTLTISPTGTTFEVMVNGRLFRKTEEIIVIPPVEGTTHIAYDSGGTLVNLGLNAGPEEFIVNTAYVANVYWSTGSSTSVVVGDERHGAEMDSATHRYLHRSIGSVYIDGLTPFGILADNGGTSDQSAVVGIGAGTFFDEDLRHTPSTIDTGATIPVLYQIGSTGQWRKNPPRIHPVMTGGTGRPLYNLNTGGVWTTPEVPANDYVLYHLFATNDIDYPVVSIMGQAVYTTVNNARIGAENEIGVLVTDNLPMAEFIPLATIIFLTKSSYTNQSKAEIISTDLGDDYIDWRTTTISAGNAASDHGALAGLADDDHPQYHNDARATTWIEGKVHNVLSATTIEGGTVHGVYFSDVANTGHTHTESEISDLGDYAERSLFESHTGDSSVHFTVASLNLSQYTTDTEFDAHTGDSSIHFTVASLNLSQYTTDTEFDVHTGNTSNPHQTSLENLVSSAHTHTESEISDLGDYAERSFFESHTGDSSVHFTVASLNLAQYTTDTEFDVHTGDTTNPHQTSLANLVSSAHTHTEADLPQSVVWESKGLTLRATRADEDVTLMYVHTDVDIISAHTVCVGTTPSVTWQLNYGTDRTSGTELASGTTTSTTTIVNGAIGSGITAGNMIWLTTTATGGTVNELHLTVSYSGA